MALTYHRISLMKDGFGAPLDFDTDIVGLNVTNINLEIEASGDPAVMSIAAIVSVLTPNIPVPPAELKNQPGVGIFTDTRIAAPTPGHFLYRKSSTLASLDLQLDNADLFDEVAVVVRPGGTSHFDFLKGLGFLWAVRGIGVQPDEVAGPDASTAFAGGLVPDARGLFKQGGYQVLVANTLPETGPIASPPALIKNPANVFYYTGHGLSKDYGVDRQGALATFVTTGDGLAAWLQPEALFAPWAAIQDLEYLVIAGCSVLKIEFVKGKAVTDSLGLRWANLLQGRGGPLKALLGYGGKAPLDDVQSANVIAKRFGGFLKTGNRGDIIKQWLDINGNAGAWGAVAIDPAEGGQYHSIRGNPKKKSDWLPFKQSLAP